MRVEDVEIVDDQVGRPYTVIGVITARVTAGAAWNKARTVEDVNSKLREVALKRGANAVINQTIDHGAHLVLPLHGGPVPLDQDTIDLRAEVHDTIQHILHRGRQDGSIRPDVTALDIIVFGALLAQPLPHIPDWKLTARRLAAIHFDGLAGAAATATEQ